MELSIDDDGKVEEIRCTGTTKMDDRPSGKKVEGEEAIYILGEETARIAGEPAIMTDLEGTQIRGRVMVYDFETATARIESQLEEGAPEVESAEDLEAGTGEEESAPEGG
jgi:hypothetical protein